VNRRRRNDSSQNGSRRNAVFPLCAYTLIHVQKVIKVFSLLLVLYFVPLILRQRFSLHIFILLGWKVTVFATLFLGHQFCQLIPIIVKARLEKFILHIAKLLWTGITFTTKDWPYCVNKVSNLIISPLSSGSEKQNWFSRLGWVVVNFYMIVWLHQLEFVSRKQSLNCYAWHKGRIYNFTNACSYKLTSQKILSSWPQKNVKQICMKRCQ